VALELVAAGYFDLAERYADRSAALTTEENAPWSLPPVYYTSGRVAKAARLHAVLDKRFAADGDYQATWAPVNTATAAIARGDHAAAVEALRVTQPLERGRPALAMLRGRALFGAGRIEEAATAFQFAVDNHMTTEPSTLRTVARIWLARARAKLGDASAARRAYQDAFATWKDADADVPLLVQARKEYAALPPDTAR
jgi:predicted Zn-dependent protease